jgi:ATP-binding cassette subfamily C (CFTR/MRP) protein 1
LIAAIFISTEIESIALGQYFFRGMRQGLRVRAAICSLVYHKSLALSLDARSRFGVGRVVSLMQIDAQKICDAIPYLHLTWSAPFQLSVALYMLYLKVPLS